MNSRVKEFDKGMFGPPFLVRSQGYKVPERDFRLPHPKSLPCFFVAWISTSVTTSTESHI